MFSQTLLSVFRTARQYACHWALAEANVESFETVKNAATNIGETKAEYCGWNQCIDSLIMPSQMAAIRLAALAFLRKVDSEFRSTPSSVSYLLDRYC